MMVQDEVNQDKTCGIGWKSERKQKQLNKNNTLNALSLDWPGAFFGVWVRFWVRFWVRQLKI